MRRSTLVIGMVGTLLALAAVHALRASRSDAGAAAESAAASTPDARGSHLYGRVTTEDGEVYEGRLRFGGDEEAFWGHYFNGVRDGNPWADRLPRAALDRSTPIEVFGIEIARWPKRVELGRPFTARFGDIARIEARGRDLRVTLRSGTVVELDRYAADDFADGVRVWDAARGVVELDEWRIRAIDFLPAPGASAAPARLYGTVRTRHGDFTGFLQWNREASLGSDELEGRTDSGDARVRFDEIRSITRRSPGSSLVRLADGREIVLSGSAGVGEGNRGIYVDDPRFGRVLVSWEVFERVDFGSGGAGPAYGDFLPGRPLTGSVRTRSGERLAGRLVFDLDESETVETLDAPAHGVDYIIPFDLVAAIVPGYEAPRAAAARVMLRGGEDLLLERAGDLSEENGGMLIFPEGRERAEYVPWAEVERIDFDSPGVARAEE